MENLLLNIFLEFSKNGIYVNPRPAGPLDFPPPAGGGGGRLNAPPPHDLGSWSP